MKIIFNCVTALFLAVGLIGSLGTPAMAGGDKGQIKFQKLDPAAAKAILLGLRAEGIDDKPISAQVTTADCPSTCNGSVHNGMCHCGRDSEGGCADGQTETNRGGKDMCKILPTTSAVVFRGRGAPLRVQTATGR